MATYSALRDQSGTVWYLTAEGLPDGLAAVLVLSSTVPPGTNLTPSLPSWLALDVAEGTGGGGDIVVPWVAPGWVPEGWMPLDSTLTSFPWVAPGWVSEGWVPLGDVPLSTRWYVWPTPAGALVIGTSPPATGTEALFPNGLLLTDAASHGWLVHVTPWRELSVEAALGTALTRTDSLSVRVFEAQALVGPKTTQTGSDTLRPRLLETFGLVQPPTMRFLRSDTLTLRLTEQALPPGARLLPLPQGVFYRGR